LEQNKARAALSTNEDDSLERVFLEASSSAPPAPKKKTREEYIQQLKAKKNNLEAVNGEKTTTEGDRPLEVSTSANKFKPVGFKPIAAPVDEKPKRKKTKEKVNDGNTKTKKRKIEKNDEKKGHAGDSRKNPADSSLPPPLPTPPNPPIPTAVLEPEPINDDFDIFADAGEYEGIDVGDENDSEDGGATSQRPPKEDEPIPIPSQPTGNWFSTEDDNPPLHQSEPLKDESDTKSNMLPPPEPTPAEEDQDQPLRLVPLESSALPSIKDFLAMDNAVEANEKRKKRKEKRKGGKGDGDGEKKLTAEVKADRDYKRFVSNSAV
jgi:hypothetical protein